MSANWNSQFIVAIGIAVTLGNALALGVHVFTWWLRRRKWPRLVMAILGGFAVLLGLRAVAYLHSFDLRFIFDILTANLPPDDWRIQSVFFLLRAFLICFVVVGSIGAVQKRQIATGWIEACLCFCFEFASSWILFAVIDAFGQITWLSSDYSFLQSRNLADTLEVAFTLSLLALAFCRPFFLIVLKYFLRCIRPNSLDVEQNL